MQPSWQSGRPLGKGAVRRPAWLALGAILAAVAALPACKQQKAPAACPPNSTEARCPRVGIDLPAGIDVEIQAFGTGE